MKVKDSERTWYKNCINIRRSRLSKTVDNKDGTASSIEVGVCKECGLAQQHRLTLAGVLSEMREVILLTELDPRILLKL